jgi:hypothetical protein
LPNIQTGLGNFYEQLLCPQIVIDTGPVIQCIGLAEPGSGDPFAVLPALVQLDQASADVDVLLKQSYEGRMIEGFIKLKKSSRRSILLAGIFSDTLRVFAPHCKSSPTAIVLTRGWLNVR